jgi:K+-sensing histidine kinase KdpD
VTGVVVGCGLVVVVTAALAPFHAHIGRATPALVLVVPVVVSGIVGGRLPAIVTAICGGLAFSLAFIPPVGTLRVRVSEDAVAQAVFIVIAVSVGTLVAREVTRRRAAEQAADEIQAMHTQYKALVKEQHRLRDEADAASLLRRVDEQRSALLRSVSHDLRTPLAAIRAVASDLRGGATYSDAVRDELLQLVCDEAERLDRLVANLLSMSRVEAGALQPDRQAVALDELASHSVERLSRVLDQINVEVCLPADLPLVDVDYVQLDQVLTNLLENAARHSPAGSTVTVSARPIGQTVEVTVADQGPGVDRHAAARLFEPFWTGGSSGTTGVGLAICKAIVEAHDGTIKAENGLDRGARFTFTVPVRNG